MSDDKPEADGEEQPEQSEPPIKLGAAQWAGGLRAVAEELEKQQPLSLPNLITMFGIGILRSQDMPPPCSDTECEDAGTEVQGGRAWCREHNPVAETREPCEECGGDPLDCGHGSETPP